MMKKWLSITFALLLMLSTAVIGVSAADKDIEAAGDDSGYTVNGVITSFLSEDDDVTISIKGSGLLSLSVKKKGNNITFTYNNIPGGKYTVNISKNNHVTRTYEIELTGDTTLEAMICPIGDVNMDGKVTTMDVTRANAHVRGAAALEGYQLLLADTTPDSDGVTTMDVTRINSHARGISSLW